MPYRIAVALVLASFVPPPAADAGDGDYFTPAHRLRGIGLDRAALTDDDLALRTDRMIDSQTFAILRDPRAAAGARRILARGLQNIFHRAEKASGVPASLIASIAYLESFGDPRAQSPTGPRGIMQISAGTARVMGLKIVYANRYRHVTRIRRVRTRSGKWISRRVRVRVRYRVRVRDDRVVPWRAIPAAAKYLARLDAKFGGLDWAVFAYHCGEGCAAAMQEVARRSDGAGGPYTVARTFFAGTPAANRDLYLAVRREMKRDYSPTYWFRVMRARSLLALYRKDPAAFRKLASEFRFSDGPDRRAPHRLAVWLRGQRVEAGGPVTALDNPDYYGFRFRASGRASIRDPNRGQAEVSVAASTAAVGALAYLAFETRRLHEAMDIDDEPFVPLEVTSTLEPGASAPVLIASGGEICVEAGSHSTGQVFDIDYGSLPPGQREAFRFVLNDLGWEGYLGFIRATPDGRLMHIGVSPSSREFFDGVFADAFARSRVGEPGHGDWPM